MGKTAERATEGGAEGEVGDSGQGRYIPEDGDPADHVVPHSSPRAIITGIVIGGGTRRGDIGRG